MAQLWYKTRGESSPDRKQKVYFSAHPRDHHLLDGIAAEILENQNCAVWYDKEPEGEFDEKELSARLEEMQLFVMPITYILLTKPCRALEFEFELARRRHIPVLPLMQEGGLDELFNEKCGDLQFLYKYSRDTTGISYEEKLKKYLEAVLVGEEDAKRIREAFAAYIFLSYRKKDREHAQKLMRLIHKVDFCRDVAIWYDEFLTPGENFTNLIKESLDKSDLFVLAVTPNLLERKNYVMQVEYPMAVKSEKPILPAEMVDTKDRKLRKKYKDISDCVDAYDNNDLRNALSKHFSSIKQNNSPEQMYLMGLAYLNGVDVEKDEEKAISLITAAAEQEHIEALEKIVQLYREGFGVKKNYDTAILWQKKLSKLREKLYRSSESEKNGIAYFNSLYDLCNCFSEMYRMEEARKLSTHMLEFSSKLAEKFNSLQVKHCLWLSYYKYGESLYNDGLFGDARDNFIKSLDTAQSEMEEHDNLQAIKDSAASSERLGDVYSAVDMATTALIYYKKSLEGYLSIPEHNSTILDRYHLAASYVNIGKICCNVSKTTSATEYYRKGLEIILSVTAEDNSVVYRRQLAENYCALADILSVSAARETALDYYKKSLDIYLDLKKECGTVQSFKDLSKNYSRLGDVCYECADYISARQYYEKSLDICLSIAKESDVEQPLDDMSNIYTKLEKICWSIGDIKAAKTYHNKQYDVYHSSFDIHKELSRKFDMLFSGFKNKPGADQFENEKEYLNKEIDRIISASQNSMDAYRNLAVSYDRLGAICEDFGDLSGAMTYYHRSIDAALKITEENNSMEARRDLSFSYKKLGKVCESSRKFKEAKSYYQQSLDMFLEIAKESSSIEADRDLSKSYDVLGDFCKATGDLIGAREYYQKGLDIAIAVTEKDKSIEAYDELAQYYMNLGLLYENYPDYFALSKARDIYEMLKKRGIVEVRTILRYSDNLDIIKKYLK